LCCMWAWICRLAQFPEVTPPDCNHPVLAKGVTFLKIQPERTTVMCMLVGPPLQPEVQGNLPEVAPSTGPQLAKGKSFLLVRSARLQWRGSWPGRGHAAACCAALCGQLLFDAFYPCHLFIRALRQQSRMPVCGTVCAVPGVWCARCLLHGMCGACGMVCARCLCRMLFAVPVVCCARCLSCGMLCALPVVSCSQCLWYDARYRTVHLGGLGPGCHLQHPAETRPAS
jgi:hypothetical protein